VIHIDGDFGMTVEMTMLLYSVILFFVLIVVQASIAIKENGAQVQAGPRDDLPEPSIFSKRVSRLCNNMMENLVIFGLLVLIANAAHVSTSLTILGAQIFFFARLAHAVIYIAGWPVIRPLAYFTGVAGCIMIALALI
jgi:uncharacterized MAPEG superfamily protein